MLIMLIVLGATITFPLVAYFILAPRNLWFTFVKEGTAKFIVRGDKLERVLIQWRGYTLDLETWDVIEGEERHIFGGFRYYGFWPLFDVHIYSFQWTGVAEDGTIVAHPREDLDYILLKEDVYYFKVKNAEDKTLLPLDIEVIFTAKVVNPYKARFRIQNWLEAVINRMAPAVRDAVTKETYQQLIKRKEAIGSEIYDKLGELLGEFKEGYGIDVLNLAIKDINPSDEAYREATLKKWLAKREREAIETRAGAEAQRIKKVFGQIQNFGDLGKLIRTLEAIEKSPLAASLSVQAIPGLQEALRGVFGHPPESISQEEVRVLREELERLKEIIKEE